MTLYDDPTTPHGHTPDEAAAIAAYLAVKQPTICPPRTHAKPEWEMQPIVSAETSNRYMRARKRRVEGAAETARVKRLSEAGNKTKRRLADEKVQCILIYRAQGMTPAEVAQAVGTNTAGVRSIMAAARRRGAI